MAFQNYLCWTESQAFAVMSTDAEHVPDQVFLAVHSDHPLTLMDTVVSNRKQGDAARWRTDAREFLRQFLDPNRRHVQAVILGASGSGKSHFIKWLTVNIPSDDSRYVLTIPKAGMSLRRIVERIIEVLPADKQGKYREQLQQVGYHSATREQLRGSLLNRIAEAIKADSRRGSANITDEQDWLLEELPNIFYDPHLRTFLDRQGGVMDELVDHIFETPTGYQRRESQRVFHASDLPLQVADINQMARQSRDVLVQLVSDPSLVVLALQIINDNLGRAIPQALNFSGEQLQQLMLDIRKFLRETGKQLVLLIEDFARLQGIDGALLQALIEAASPDNGLCEMRWAMAVTHGYYEQMANTVQTRTDFIVDMDLATGGADGVITDDDIVAFAARYLNAARLTDDQLMRWHEEQMRTGNEVDVPNACEACSHRHSCHAAFGTENNTGLYPFSRKAVLNMARRRDAHLDERFNPRVLIKDVLAQVLGNYHRELAQGQFPPGSLLQVMGKSQFAPAVADALKRDQPELAERRLALLGLWSAKPNEPDQLAEGIYSAFSLPAVPPQVLGKQPEVTPPGPNPPPLPPPPPPGDRNIEAIQAWGRGGEGRMPEYLVQPLRRLIYPLVETYLNWDTAGLVRMDFSRPTDGDHFKARHIYFRRMETTFLGAAMGVTLPIPLDEADQDELLETAIALEGLLRFQQSKSWNFAGGAQALAALNECLRRWSEHLMQQFLRIPDGEGTWDPVPSAVEVLAVGAALAGRPVSAESPLVDQLNALFESWPKDAAANQSPLWRALYDALHEQQEFATGLVQQWASGVKGGQAGNFLDVSRIIPALRQVHSSWTPLAVPPATLTARRGGTYGSLNKLHSMIRADLPKVAKAEWKRRVEWLAEARHNIPESTSWTEAVQALQLLMQEVKAKGIGYRQPVMQSLENELRASAGLRFDALVAELSGLDRIQDPTSVLLRLSRADSTAAMVQAERLFSSAKQFLTEVEAEAGNRESALTNSELVVQKEQARIEKGLDELVDVLGVLGGNHAS